MKKIATIVLAFVVLVSVGCNTVPVAEHNAFVDSMDRASQILVKDLTQYYKEDDALSEAQKDRRMKLIEEYLNNIKTARKKED